MYTGPPLQCRTRVAETEKLHRMQFSTSLARSGCVCRICGRDGGVGWGSGGGAGNAWLELSWKHVPKGLERKRKDTQSVDVAVQVCQFIHLVNRVGPFYRTHGSCRVPPSQPPFPPGSPPHLPSPRRSCFTRPHNAIWNKCSVGSLTASKLQQWSGKEKRILKKNKNKTPDMWDHPMIIPNHSWAFQNA